MFETSGSRSRRKCASVFRSSDVSLGLILGFRIMGGLYLLGGRVRMHRNSADKTLKVSEAFAEDNHARGRDFILANILGMIPAAHFDHHHNLAKLAIDGYVSQPDDVIGKKRN